MLGMGLPELFVIALVATFVFGPDKLPGLAKQAGQTIRTIRRMADSAKLDFERDVAARVALDSDDVSPFAAIQKHILDDAESE